ncbi:unnamed protein product [Echinostoma caproni]|uniref:UDENN domain-containing protein n=1 Tax=Echinostoma caproni TaxID=27848 RepID=A0A183BBG6_9TREM|nr:unnamed protein product [Echinostoma caproni]
MTEFHIGDHSVQFDGFLVARYLIVSLIPFTVQTQCIVTNPSLNATLPYWSMRAFPNLIYAYGFPVDYIGGILSTVYIREVDCRLEDRHTRKCMHRVIPQYCHFDLKQLATLRDQSIVVNETCPFSIRSSIQGAAKSVPIERRMLMIEPAPQTKPPQSKYELLLTRVKTFFEECGKCRHLENVAGTIICRYTSYMDLFREKQLEADEISWDISEKVVLSKLNKRLLRKLSRMLHK